MSNLDFEKNPLNRPAFWHQLHPERPAEYRTWVEWHKVHTELEQKLAQRLRVYTGPAPQETPPDGGQSGAGRGDIILQRRAA